MVAFHFSFLKTRDDFIQHMVEIEQEETSLKDKKDDINSKDENLSKLRVKKTLTFNEILCTSMLFLSAGYETTSTALCFLAYNLAMHTECQEKLIEEIDRVLEKHVKIFNMIS